MERNRAALLCMVFLLAGCGGGDDLIGPDGGGGGGGGGSTLTLSVDGGGVATSDVTTGVEAGSTTFVVAAAGNATIRLGFPGTAAGTFPSGSAGGTVTYLDGTGAVFDAADGLAGSSYTITVTGYSGGRVTGSYTATVVASNGATHTVSGSFSAVPPGAVTGRPYEGRYIGIFRARYVVCNVSPCGPEQSRAFRVIFELGYVGPGWEMQEYDVTYAKVADPYFGCTGGCYPSAAGALAYLPNPPGDLSNAAEWIGVGFANGKRLETDAGSGSMLTSGNGGVVSSGACSNDLCWTGWQSDPADWSKGWETTLPANSQLRAQTWWLAKSAL